MRWDENYDAKSRDDMRHEAESYTSPIPEGDSDVDRCIIRLATNGTNQRIRRIVVGEDRRKQKENNTCRLFVLGKAKYNYENATLAGRSTPQK
jgi:hypothetical protein